MDLFRFDPPDLTDAEVRRIADELYGLSGETRRLRGERSHNTRVISPTGDEFVLRVASASEPDAAIDCPAQALLHLERTAPQLPVARLIPSRNGQLVPATIHDGRRHMVRLETFLPGVTFDDEQLVRPEAMRAIGELLGGVAAALADFEHPAADGFLAWDIANGLALDPALHAALPSDARLLVDRARPRLESAQEAMATLPRQVIHNDGHAGNLLRPDRHSDQVIGVIDFGDLVRTVAAADIAVCGASLVPHQADAAAALAALTAGYHAQRPLTSAEVAAIPDLLLTRLVLSTLLIEYQLAHAPHMAEAVTPERVSTLANLARWLEHDPVEVRNRIEAPL